MNIVVKRNDGSNIQLPIPSGLVLNRLAAGFLRQCLKQHGVGITRKQAVVFMKALNQYRHTHPEWVLVQAQSSHGNYVEVTL